VAGNNVRFSGLEINRMVDGRVAEHWVQLDAVTLFEQLGLHIVSGARLLPRLLASPVRRLFAKRRRKVPSQGQRSSRTSLAVRPGNRRAGRSAAYLRKSALLHSATSAALSAMGAS
jgi:hypothetical protein